MSNSRSVLGVLQQEARGTAENLDATAAGLRQYEPPLKACLTHTRDAVGDSHQSDVAELEQVVTAAIQAINECADSTSASARRVREIEART